jgi:hypothetical protein
MAKGDGQDRSKKKAKVPKTRADALLVERGLAAHQNEALALILKKAVIADEGKIIVDKASTMLPQVLLIYCYFLSILLDYDLIVDKASTVSTVFCPTLASPSPRARARARTHLHHTHTNTHTHTHTQHTHTHVLHACMCVFVCVCVCTHTYIHTFMHTHIHSYIDVGPKM